MEVHERCMLGSDPQFHIHTLFWLYTDNSDSGKPCWKPPLPAVFEWRYPELQSGDRKSPSSSFANTNKYHFQNHVQLH